MNRTDRLSAILIQLQGKRVVRAQEIADRFEISLRTVYRDIRALEEAGIPIGAEAGLGYYLMDHYHLPPVMFTNEEASALIFGEKLIEKMSDEKIKTDFASALYKIKAILKPGEKDHLEKLNERIAVFNLSTMSDNFNQLHLNEIQHALVNKQIIEINYENRKSDEPTNRRVEPIGLCNYSSRWHLFAWCQMRNDYRDFRLDRIKSLKVTTENFKGKQHPSIKEFMQMMNPISNTPNISILVPKEKAKRIDDSKYWYGFIGEEDAGNTLRMQFSNDELNGFALWLLNSGCAAKIEEPSDLQEIIRNRIQEMLANYGELS